MPIENKLKDIKDTSYISYHILSLAYRFKRLKINKRYRKYYTIPFREDMDLSLRYIISITELLIKAYGLKDQNIDIYINKFEDKFINLYLKRYFHKRYKINLKFVILGRIIIPKKQIHFSFRSCNPLSLFSIFKLIPFKTKKIPLNILEKKILKVSSFKKKRCHITLIKMKTPLKIKCIA